MPDQTHVTTDNYHVDFILVDAVSARSVSLGQDWTRVIGRWDDAPRVDARWQVFARKLLTLHSATPSYRNRSPTGRGLSLIWRNAQCWRVQWSSTRSLPSLTSDTTLCLLSANVFTAVLHYCLHYYKVHNDHQFYFLKTAY